MKMKTLIAVAVAGAFAVPFAAQASADNDRMILAQSGGSSGAPGGASSMGGAGGPGTGGGAAAGGGTGSAPGGTGAGLPPTDLQQLDTDNDGYVTRAEADKDPSMGTRFSELDKDSDGRISREEWQASGTAATGATGATGTTTEQRDPAADESTASQRPPQQRGLPGTSTK